MLVRYSLRSIGGAKVCHGIWGLTIVYAAKQLMHGACMAWPAEVHRDSNATVMSIISSGEP